MPTVPIGLGASELSKNQATMNFSEDGNANGTGVTLMSNSNVASIPFDGPN
jgi:hypothetical protein